MSKAARDVVQSLLRAETEINLLGRCNPSNLGVLAASLREQWRSGRTSEPAFEYSPRPDLSGLKRALDSLMQWLASRGPWGAVWAARAAELILEADMVEAIGTRALLPLACRRFPSGIDREHRAIERLARRWVALDVERPCQDSISSDDESNPNSLICLMRAELERVKVPFPIRIGPRMAARAAVDDVAVWIKPRVPLRPEHARRIVAHEVHGHVIRRYSGRQDKNLHFRCGVVGADVDEEGRALCVEARLGHLDAFRKVELGRRHLAALACRRGATFSDGIRLLLELATPLDEALAIALRVWRGGGLAREVVYLTGHFRAARWLRRYPELDEWMTQGRLSFEIAARLARGDLPDVTP